MTYLRKHALMTDATSKAKSRPLSPHLQVYRWTITMATSILHRAAGVAMVFFGFVFVVGLTALSSGAQGFGEFLGLLTSPLGIVAMVGFSGAFWFYLLKEIQHLFNAIGVGLELKDAHKTGWFVLGCSILLTALTWYIIFIGLPS